MTDCLPTPDAVRLADFSGRQTRRTILATTAMYGPWLPDGTFDFESYADLVREALVTGSVPATNVDTTWAQYNTWELAKDIIVCTARVAAEHGSLFPAERPLLVAGLNTNSEDLTVRDISRSIRAKVEEISAAVSDLGVRRVRYMPVPDRRLLGADVATKVHVYQEIGRVVADHTDHGMVLFELDIGIPGFGSDFTVEDIAEILTGVPQIQEYKSALIAPKTGRWAYPYDFRDDLARLAVVEQVASDRVQFSTGNDWCIALARLGANLCRSGYLLGASQMAPGLFQLWRRLVESDDPGAIGLEQDLQAAARDFWTAGNVGIYRHYIAILLALTGRIAHALPHPKVDSRFIVRPEDYWRPLKHAIRLGLLSREEAPERARQYIPGASAMAVSDLQRKVALMG